MGYLKDSIPSRLFLVVGIICLIMFFFVDIPSAEFYILLVSAAVDFIGFTLSILRLKKKGGEKDDTNQENH